MNESNLQVIKEFQSFLQEKISNKSSYVTNPSHFSRENKKLSFEKVILFILSLPKQSISIALSGFFEKLDEVKNICSNSAFSQARYKITWELFSEMAKFSSNTFFKTKPVKRWRDYRLEGVDGTILNLVNTSVLSEYFGIQHNGTETYVQARAVVRYDLLNQIVTDSSLGRLDQGEKVYAIEQLTEVSEDVISIYDRHYPSFEFIYEHIQHNLSFVMRSKINFNSQISAFVKSGKQSDIIVLPITKMGLKNLTSKGYLVDKSTTVKIRVERIDLCNGGVEILLTNLFELEITNDDFKTLYNMRWGSETNYDCLKNKLEIELFTGQKPISILQDFYATIAVFNLNSMLIEGCESEVKEISLRRTHDYKVNRNVSIGLMKSKIIKLLFCKDLNELTQVLNFLKEGFIKNLQPIRPKRTYPRKRKKIAGLRKIRPLKNYKRAS